MGGMTGLLLLLSVGVTMSAVVNLQKRIIGGSTCTDAERLYHVQLQYSSGALLCGGSLIHNQWVLTAAHCLEPNMKAVVGVHPKDKQNKTVGIEKYEIHKDKDGHEHDIMLLKLNEAVDGITPIKLPDLKKDCEKLPKKNASMQVAGHAQAGGTTANTTLQCKDLKVDDYSDLRGPFPKYNFYRKVLWGKTSGPVACKGDSGGGVVHGDIIYGVLITAIGCTEEPLSTNVCYYLDWITKGMKK